MKDLPEGVLAPAIAAAREGRLVILAGAGLSALSPSNVPRWTELYDALLDAMCKVGVRALELSPETLTSEILLSQSSLDNISQVLIGNCSPAAIFPLFSAIRGAPLNDAHRAIARIAGAGGLKALLTTNFDLLLETTLSRNNVAYIAYTPHDVGRHRQAAEIPIVKLHGSLVQPESLIETAGQKLRPIAPHIDAACAEATKNAYILIVGYSGADPNVIALLQKYAAPASMLWLSPPGRDLAEEALPLLEAGARRVQADVVSVLTALADGLGAAQSPMAPDTSPLDPREELAKAAEAWANSIPMNRWVIAAIVVRILPPKHALIGAIEERVKKGAEKLADGARLDHEDIGLPSVLGALASAHISQMHYDIANDYLRTSLTIQESFQHAFVQHGGQGPGARREYYANSANTLINLGVGHTMAGNPAEGLKFTQRALERAMEGDVPEGFFGALANIFQFHSGITHIWPALWEIPAARAAARRLGLLQVYLELTALEAFFRAERGETEQAMELVDHMFAIEKGDIEATVHKGPVASAHILRSYVWLRRGDIAKAWSTFSAAIWTESSTFTYTQQSIQVAREFMPVFGVQDVTEILDLAKARAPAPEKPSRETAAIEPTSKLPLPYPDHGLIGVRDSACAHPLEMSLLWKLAVVEFWDDDALYYEMRENQCAWLRSVGAHEAVYRSAMEMILRARRTSIVQHSAWFAFAAAGAAETCRLPEAKHLIAEGLAHFDPGHPGASFAASIFLYLAVRVGWTSLAEAAARAFVDLARVTGAPHRNVAPLSEWLGQETSQARSEAASAALAMVEPLRGLEAAAPAHWYDVLDVNVAALDPDLGRTRSAYDKGDRERGRSLQGWLADIRRAAMGGDYQAARAAFGKIIEVAKDDPSYRDVEVQGLVSYAQAVMQFETELEERERQINLILFRLLSLNAYSAIGAVQTLRIWGDIIDPSRDPQEAPQSYKNGRWLFWLDREPMTQMARARIERFGALWNGDLAAANIFNEEADDMAAYFAAYALIDRNKSSPPAETSTARPRSDQAIRRSTIVEAEDLGAARKAWRSILREMPKRSIERTALGDTFAHWCLRNRHFNQAIKAYAWCEREFSALNEAGGRALAVSGASRALRLSGKPLAARARLTRALRAMTPDHREWHNLHIALASAWFDIARRRILKRGALRRAEDMFRLTANESPNITERGRARLGLAVILGLGKRQEEALVAVRLAEEDLSHAAPQEAAALRAGMPIFESGDWSRIRF
ncbi:SIR2 family NAD-dependent protein deacylase [Vitreimonas flagellata]|uniref:SIR2 family NAD-dependent protein deacylase n=1 Tax=Vitreimonas flagellata TaxID=2560861 RepID=UPI001430CF5F|nr:SIR2 family protein [Vitreimonas flagellata]